MDEYRKGTPVYNNLDADMANMFIQESYEPEEIDNRLYHPNQEAIEVLR